MYYQGALFNYMYLVETKIFKKLEFFIVDMFTRNANVQNSRNDIGHVDGHCLGIGTAIDGLSLV